MFPAKDLASCRRPPPIIQKPCLRGNTDDWRWCQTDLRPETPQQSQSHKRRVVQRRDNCASCLSAPSTARSGGRGGLRKSFVRAAACSGVQLIPDAARSKSSLSLYPLPLLPLVQLPPLPRLLPLAEDVSRPLPTGNVLTGDGRNSAPSRRAAWDLQEGANFQRANFQILCRYL
jgi:hypothetical protein